MKLTLILFFCLAQLTLLAQPIKHNFVCTDYTQGKVFIISEEENAVWEYPAMHCNDVWMLPNGNILFNCGKGVKEVTRDKQIVFEYNSESDIYACQRLSNGNTFIGESNSGKLLEVAPNGTIIRCVKLLPDSVDGGYAFMRNARKLNNGNYLVAHYGIDMVREYNADGKMVLEFPIKGGPHSVVRLPDGNTLVACSDHNGEPKVVEFDHSGKVVWQVLKNDLPGIELKFMTGLQRLPNGNTVMTNWLGHNQFGQAPHAIEVTHDKKVVWFYSDSSFIQTMSSIQLIDEESDPKTSVVLH